MEEWRCTDLKVRVSVSIHQCENMRRKFWFEKIGENDKYTVCNIENFDFYDYTYKNSVNINKKQEID